MDKAIITSILDTDIYKFHMQQAIFHLYKETCVNLSFVCRNHEDLVPYFSEIKAQIFALSNIKLTSDEYLYLKNLGYYKQDYLDYLRTYQFDINQLTISIVDSQLSIQISGPWFQVVLWEVPILAIISEVRNRIRYPQICDKDVLNVLKPKIELIKQSHYDGFKLIDFGTRRRFSKNVQGIVVDTLKRDLPNQFIGTSNCMFANEFNLDPIGTQAHEWFQGHQQLTVDLRIFQKLALESWLKEYPDSLGIALTDCVGMTAFLNDFDATLANKYLGLRHDSGDPIIWGEQAIEHYKKLNIEPRTKNLVFSDGLNIPKALEIYKYFQGVINTSFGIGTNLTCDLVGVVPMNIVLKMTECNGLPVAKISDSPGKTICNDVQYINKLLKAFNFTPSM